MQRILIVTSRNMACPGGELSLVKNRASALESKWGVSSELLSLVNSRLNVKSGEEAYGEGTYITCDFLNPAALLNGYNKLIKEALYRLSGGNYSAVIVSGVGLLRFVDSFKKAAGANTLVCADIHGFYGDGAFLAKDESFMMGSFHRLASHEDKYEQLRLLRKFDRIFVVSDAYKNYLMDKAGCSAEQFYVVPCAIDLKWRLSADDRERYRLAYREKYGFLDQERVFLYSGGASSWQCLKETVALYREIKKSSLARLIILTGDLDGVNKEIGEAPDVIVDSYLPSELPGVFCTADACMMLRADHPTNLYAYPNKFLEYVSAHKPVIATPYVLDVASQIDNYNVGVMYMGDTFELLTSLDNISNRPQQYEQLIEAVSFERTLVPFVDDLNRFCQSIS